jgi:hypothetical protein
MHNWFGLIFTVQSVVGEFPRWIRRKKMTDPEIFGGFSI